ncbi:MAG: ROK family protein [Spirochaetales bacterium]|nr:ROK family protein [Spirochaetales bacterium]
MAKYYVGIDVGGTSAKIGLVNEKGEIERKEQVQTLKSQDWHEIIDEFIRPVRDWFDEKIEIAGIGLGAPGFFNKNTGCLHNCENIPGLINAPFVEYMKQQFPGVPVYADNDATCAAIGEHIFGAGRKYTDYLMVTVGTGIGGGLILNDKVYRGRDGYAGELGHVIAVPDGKRCTCGNKGCIESYASATSIIERVRDGIKKGYITKSYADVKPEDINAKIVWDKARAGCQYSKDAIDSAARYLGMFLGGIVNLLNIQAIIIGGGVAVETDFIERIKYFCCQSAWHTFTQNLDVVSAELKNNAGIIGAASLVLEAEK